MKKLFIYIPTYNRPAALDKQLRILLPTIISLPHAVRILINDNASTKEFSNLVDEYSNYSNIEFRSNCGNIGGNANIALGFIFAKPDEFLWILSDNDIVTKSAIEYILNNLDDSVDFYCFNYAVNEPKVFNCIWDESCQLAMDWRLGLISDGLYNINSIKDSISDAFFYHNSSFPHLAVAFSAMRKKKLVKYKLLPRSQINSSNYDSSEYPTDYSLANVGMPILIDLLSKNEARKFAKAWLIKHGISFFRNRKKHYSVYLHSKSILQNSVGFEIRMLLILVRLVYVMFLPWLLIRPRLVAIAKNYLSQSVLDKIRKIRNHQI